MEDHLSEYSTKYKEETYEIELRHTHCMTKSTVHHMNETHFALYEYHHIKRTNRSEDNKVGEESMIASRVPDLYIGYDDYHAVYMSTCNPEIRWLTLVIIQSIWPFKSMEANDLKH
jgi:hypothetical protein